MDKFRLRGGMEVEIRAIVPGDAARLKAAHGRLSPESKYSRYLAPKPDLTSADTRYLVEIDGTDHVALVAISVEDPELILGVARFVRLPEDPRAAEFAIVVGDPWQRQGLASKLLERLADAAVERGIDRFRATMLSDNVAAHRLVERLAGRLAPARNRGPIDELEVQTRDLAAQSQLDLGAQSQPDLAA
jgi:RimJ/RimL family protein N-acetyltransferase